ncbi:hypothetical protein DKM44_13210 [Deinococcus irradiatisoli]|uniref:Uncharacterized protein n=1 Tax=Deinococcus irradiatisoli TaxID=2202254 RepID=A0A2Z3JU22_9DEIO|nr:hypothetical protein [Deinococcus irradiatisoli]AWN24074.1 hypothetical protein DKM44_13210 [Deinococcus irradiatisoli]
MPRVHLIDAQTGEVLEDLDFFETANQGRTRCARHADQMLTWTRSLDGLWIAECEEEVYHVEPDRMEQATFDSGLSD